MTARRLAPERLPDWPRLLSAELAAAYVGVSLSGFAAQVGRIWPAPARIGRRTLWDRKDLDEAVDRLKRNGGPSPDPLMEAIDGMGPRHAH